MRRCAYLLALIVAPWAESATRYVVPGGSAPAAPYDSWARAATSIQAAIDAASNADTIMVSNGVYHLQATLEITKYVSLASVNGPGVTILDGQGLRRCLHAEGVGFALRGFTIRNGNAGAGSGGGILVDHGDLRLEDCVVTANRAASGGGLCHWGLGEVRNCVFHDNEATAGPGGGLFVAPPVPVDRCLIYSNRAAGSGGGIYMDFAGQLQSSLVYGNASGYRGGGVGGRGASNIRACTIADNHAAEGGGISGDFPYIFGNIICFNTDESGAPNGTGLEDLVGLNLIGVDPLFVDRANRNYRIQPGSPALDGAPDAAPFGIYQDFDGRPRNADGDLDSSAAPDFGAYEYWPTGQCGYAVQWRLHAFDAPGGESTITVAAAPACSWQAGAHSDWVVIPDPGPFTDTRSFTFRVAPNPQAQEREGFLTVGDLVVTVRQAAAATPVYDIEGDGADDLGTFLSSKKEWRVRRSADGLVERRIFGTKSSLPAPGNFDEDRRMDVAVLDARSGNWMVRQSGNGAIRTLNWGWPGAFPVPGNYLGDSLTDFAVYDHRAGNWYLLANDAQIAETRNWGWSAAIPVPQDYDGDGVTDLAVYHPAAGHWYIHESRSGVLRLEQWGWAASAPVPADFDGDNKADLAVYHPASGNWFIRGSFDGAARIQNWGAKGLAPAPGDFNGDHFADLAVYSSGSRMWFVLMSQGGAWAIPSSAGAGARPIQIQHHLSRSFGLLP